MKSMYSVRFTLFHLTVKRVYWKKSVFNIFLMNIYLIIVNKYYNFKKVMYSFQNLICNRKNAFFYNNLILYNYENDKKRKC